MRVEEVAEYERIGRARLYARGFDVSIAYQVTGEGPFDIVFVPGSISHVELMWQVPVIAGIYGGLASFARLIVFDKRGTGMSDPVTTDFDLETRMDDVRAVMDAVGSDRAALFGVSEGAPMCILFAATYPDRTWSLVLYAALARTLRAPDYPWGPTQTEYLQAGVAGVSAWGDPESILEVARGASPTGSEEEVKALANAARHGATPGMLGALDRMNMQIDVRAVLPAIRVPTLVMHRPTDTWVPIGGARYIAERVPGATFVELPGEGHVGSAADSKAMTDEAQSFLQRAWALMGSMDAEPDRVLATVMFTDIVGSTERAAQMGDREWHKVLARHHEVVRTQLLRFRGVEVDTAGDGFFASFDGPARAIRCARAISESVGELGLEIRAGLHTGECELVDGKVAGIAVHTGARVASRCRPGEVLVSGTVKDLVAGSGIEFADRGVTELKGIPGEWHLYAVAAG